VAFVSYPHPTLAAKAEPAPVDARLTAIGARLCAAAIEARAYGLAAAHIGEAAPVIVLNTTPEGPEPSYAVYYNPQIFAVSPDSEAGREASVSLPGVEAEIVRPTWVDIGFQDASGQHRVERLEGFLARCAVHEIEQMNGRFFLLNLSRLKRDMVLKKARKARG
jgi:peptide deformylase